MKKNTDQLAQLKQMLSALRDEQSGCQWCREQTLDSLTRYTIEEAYEVNAAIKENNPQALKDELADLLLQVVFYSQIAAEEQLFTLDDVCDTLIEKLERRNPHVFKEPAALSIPELEQQWLKIKAQEQQSPSPQTGWLDHIPASLPPILRSEKIQSRSAEANLDWQTTDEVIKALLDEVTELQEAHEQLSHKEVVSELGDIAFTCVNLARHLDTTVEDAIHLTNEKFLRRFRYIEAALSKEGRRCQELSFEELLVYWNQAKAKE